MTSFLTPQDIVATNGQELPAFRSDWALFLDFDGTLTEIAPAPHLVDIADDLPVVLTTLSTRFDGAVALVSGRPLAQLDAMTGVTLAGAGVHGLEMRRTPHEDARKLKHSLDFEVLMPRVEAIAERFPGVVLECKESAVALHYRSVPEMRERLEKEVLALVAQIDDLSVIDGKMVFELKPSFANKGAAIASLMEHPPFAGRVPVFAGDDTTDEYGFETVNALGGYSIKVGEGATKAHFRVGSVALFLDWLRAVAAWEPGRF